MTGLDEVVELHCSVEGCTRTVYPADSQANPQEILCAEHQRIRTIYGVPERPKALIGRGRCSHKLVWQSEHLARSWDFDIEDRDELCAEPEIGNELCILHLAEIWNDETFRLTRRALRLWQDQRSLADEPFVGDDTWRVLAEIDRLMQTREKRIMSWRGEEPLGYDIVHRSGELYVSYDRDHRIRFAFEMSPLCIGRNVGLEPEEVRYHLRHLQDAGYVKEDESSNLPKQLIVTKTEMTDSWTVKSMVGHLRRSPTTVGSVARGYITRPVPEGPGDVIAAHQGQSMALTQKGRLELRSWQTRREQEQGEKRRRHRETTFTVVLIILTTVLLMSAVADAPDALENVKEWFHLG